MGWERDEQKKHGDHSGACGNAARIVDAARAAARRRNDRERALNAIGATAAVLLLIAAIAALIGTRWA